MDEQVSCRIIICSVLNAHSLPSQDSKQISSNSSQKSQHPNHCNYDSRQRRANSDPADCLFLERVEPLAESGELCLHAVAAVLASDDNFESKEAAVEGGKTVAHGFAATFATFGKIVERFFVAHFLVASLA